MALPANPRPVQEPPRCGLGRRTAVLNRRSGAAASVAVAVAQAVTFAFAVAVAVALSKLIACTTWPAGALPAAGVAGAITIAVAAAWW